MRFLFAGLVFLMLATPVAGHELSVYTVVVNSEGAYPADIPNGSLKEGDAAWFWMKDSTENATLVVEIEKDGATMRSPILHYECELDENGTIVDENCKNRFDYTFNQYNSAGLWNLTFMKYVNETLVETINGSVNIEPDIHNNETDIHNNETVVEEESSTKTEWLSKEYLAGGVAVVSLIAMAVIATSLKQEEFKEEV
ncbi:MAG: hypothetical protein ACJZ2K_05960 [Candidatus Poseidoniaceae archaeon]